MWKRVSKMIDLGLVGLTELTGLFTRGPKLRHLLPMHCFLGNIYIISLVAIINKLMLLLCDFSLLDKNSRYCERTGEIPMPPAQNTAGRFSPWSNKVHEPPICTSTGVPSAPSDLLWTQAAGGWLEFLTARTSRGSKDGLLAMLKPPIFRKQRRRLRQKNNWTWFINKWMTHPFVRLDNEIHPLPWGKRRERRHFKL